MGNQYEIKEGSFKAEFDSLYKFRCPEWFREEKIGI